MTDWELPQLDRKKCVACGTCVDICPQGVLAMGADGLTFAHPEKCTYCGTCEEICPHDAVVCSYEIGWA
jgi:formate hydrogenlyase subunit 6/NADH:ubiquinone oxidoreductase subunit I